MSSRFMLQVPLSSIGIGRDFYHVSGIAAAPATLAEPQTEYMPEQYLKKILTSRVYDVARETPLDRAPSLGRRLGCNVWLKREDTQDVFSFKIRGAYNKMVHLQPDILARGVVAASAGNHAQGVAMAAQKLRTTATIFMPVTTPAIKVAAVRNLGARVRMTGESF